MSADITLINPFTGNRRMPPLGLLYIASYLEKHGFSVKIIDPFSEGREEYVSKSPYVGITCMSNQWVEVQEIARTIKENDPDVTVVVGGVHPTVDTSSVIENLNVDIAVVGEGEKAVCRIVRDGIKQGIVQGEANENLDELPFPARHLINMEKYLSRDTVVPFNWLRGTTIITSRGCPFGCIFCLNSKKPMFGKTVHYHSPSYVEAEVEQLVSKYRVKGLYFYDDNFSTWKERAMEICKRISRFDLKWLCQSRGDALDMQLLVALKDAGCSGISFGVESGSPSVLSALNKRLDLQKTVEAFEMCRQTGIKTLANIIIGSPTETVEDIMLTDKLLEKIKPDYVDVWYLTAHRGTVLYDMASEQGWFREDASFRVDEPQVMINFSLHQLEEIRKGLLQKHRPFLRSLKPYLNGYFVYDMLRLLIRKPSLLLKGVDDWENASREAL